MTVRINFMFFSFLFLNDTATTGTYTLSLHDALPICDHRRDRQWRAHIRLTVDPRRSGAGLRRVAPAGDRKSTRLNSSHGYISYAVFCLKKNIVRATLVLPVPQSCLLATQLPISSSAA